MSWGLVAKSRLSMTSSLRHFQLKCVFILALPRRNFRRLSHFKLLSEQILVRTHSWQTAVFGKATVGLTLSVWRARRVWLQSEHKINTTVDGFVCLPPHLESSSFQQADLVVLREVAESRDPLGEVDHLAHGGGEAHGELLPDLLAWLVGVHVRRGVHRTDLNKTWRQNVSQGAWTEASLDF